MSAYLPWKSHVSPAMNHVSWEVREAIRSLAAANGDTDLTILSDWSKSGRGSRDPSPPRYARGCELIVAGKGQDAIQLFHFETGPIRKELLDLAETCKTAGVRVKLARKATWTSQRLTG